MQRWDELGRRLTAEFQYVSQDALPLSLEHDLSEVVKNPDLIYPRVCCDLNASALPDIRPS